MNLSKQTIKKAISVLLLVAITVGICTSCNQTAKDTDKNGRVIISVGGWPSKSGAELDRIEKQKAEFEADNSDVVVDPDTWKFDLRTFFPKAEAGMLPTVYYTYFTELPQIINGGYSSDLSKVLKKRGYEGKFEPKILKLISNDDGIYAFPYAAYVLGLAYNTELFEAAGLMEEDGTPKQPKDWNELVDFAVKIKNETGKSGFVFPTTGNSGGWLFTNIAWSYGTEFMKQDDDGKWKATFNTAECEKALQFIKDLKWKYDVVPANTLIDATEYTRTFATGEAAMMIESGSLDYKVAAYDMKLDNIGIMALPAGPARHVTLLGGNVSVMANNATEKQIDAAVRWNEKRGYGSELTEDAKATLESGIKQKVERNMLVGIKSMSVWNSDTEIAKYKNSMIDKYANSNPNHVRLYNEFLQSNVEVQAEEPVCAQDLYGVLDNCIQEVLNNKDANCKELLEKANSDFQINFLNNIDY